MAAVDLREPLAAARLAMVRLRAALPRDRELVELAVADVIRALVLARRSMRDAIAEVVEVDTEGRDLIEVAARAMALACHAAENR